MSVLQDRVASQLASSYRIERELGQGGMATVFLAHDLKHGRRVALKVLHPELAHALGPERFRREIEIAARLQHPQILTVFDSGTTDGLLWYTMPFVEGESLRDLLSRERELSVEMALQISHEVADALNYAHAQGVVHRDIKPENILLSRGHALVADFGIAHALNEESGRLTATGLAVGTPAYMSPEQADGDRLVEPRSDLYSLACVTFEMLIGETPYTGTTARAIMMKRATDPVPSPRRLRQAIPEHVDRAIVRALSPIPADRYVSTSEYATALFAATDTRQIRRSSRRTWIAFGVGAIVFASVVAAITLQRPREAPVAPAFSVHLERGDFLLSKRTPEAAIEALAEFEAALALNPRAARALAKIGYTYSLFADWGWAFRGLTTPQLRARAVEYSDRAIAADSTAAEAWLTRAYVLSENDPYHMRGALEAFERALAIDSTTSEGWYQFGQALMALGKDVRAASAYRRAFSLDPNRPMALMSLSAMSMQAGNIAEARQLIDSAVTASRTVTSPYVRVVRGLIELADGDVRAARDDAELALAMDTTFTLPARSLLVLVFAAEGDSARARDEAARVLREMGSGEPTPTTARFAASALTAVGRRDDAIALIERARPRGAYLWFSLHSLELRSLRSDPRFARVYREADPTQPGGSGR